MDKSEKLLISKGRDNEGNWQFKTVELEVFASDASKVASTKTLHKFKLKFKPNSEHSINFFDRDWILILERDLNDGVQITVFPKPKKDYHCYTSGHLNIQEGLKEILANKISFNLISPNGKFAICYNEKKIHIATLRKKNSNTLEWCAGTDMPIDIINHLD